MSYAETDLYTPTMSAVLPSEETSSTDAVVMLMPDGTIRECNQSWHNLVRETAGDDDLARPGNNYLAVIDALFEPGNSYLYHLSHGLGQIARHELDHIALEVPYAWAGGWRWFLIEMDAHPVDGMRAVLLRQRNVDSI